ISRAEGGGFTPPDPTGAAGPNHYVNSVNVAIKIFDKTGGLLAGPTDLGTFLGSGNNSGDPIILYDQLADRYFVSQFGAASNSLVLGVSETPDPTGSYFVYEFVLDAFPDYPHYSIWPDGYYLTANKFSGNTTYVLERDVILAGGANPQIVGFNLPGVVNNSNTVFSPEPANLLGTTFPANLPGYIVYLQDDGWSGAITFDHLKIWEIDVDWGTIGNSTISTPLEVPVDPFDSVFAPFGTGDVNQPGTGQKIDMIGGIISYAANYRSFGTHNSWVITFNVDVDGNDTSGVRWIELRNDATNPWDVYQEGTYAPADGHSRFMGSAAMDAAGNIGLGFNIASATLPAGIRYTGRFDGDPLGTMTVAETTIVDGIGVQTTSNRFGDYSHLTMDPDNFTFWHTAEYFTANNNWQSRVASFTLSSGFTNDVGVNNIIQPTNGILSATETVEVSIRNFGLAAQSNIPLELRVDGNLIATETFTGTVNANDVATYTFTATVDLSTSGQTYNIEVNTDLGGDEFAANDSFSKEVTHLLADDVGALEIVNPDTGSGLGMETVSVNIKNFGASPQSNFDVQYSINGGTPVVETFTATINSEEEIIYDFAQMGDFTALGSYTIVASTSLGSDQDNSNDEVTKEVDNVLCQPSMDCSFGDGFELFSVAEINNPSGCEGYADFTNLVATLDPGTTYDLTVTTGYGDQFVSVWIDFNDDFNFTPDELVVDNYEIADGQASGTYTETFDLVVPASATLGLHTMRAKTNWNAPVPADPCEVTTYGETEDYSANIGGILGLNDISFSDSEILVKTLPNNQFEVLLNTNYDGPAFAAIYNTLGQQLKAIALSKTNENQYLINLDMSSASSGVYLIKVGMENGNQYKTARIIVK
ncbi:MAG: T9SS type A sorting domain-containing protein, partial [Flavobacteriaceae bacterium]|nr:T9SS type A sorting domain-containing protein [Flavobacteriaceae bacterium]